MYIQQTKKQFVAVCIEFDHLARIAATDFRFRCKAENDLIERAIEFTN